MNILNRWILFAIGLGLALINFNYGISQDTDAYLITYKSWYFFEYGEFHQSRTWGFPLYEICVYPIIHFMGFSYAKLFSLLWFVGAISVFYGLTGFVTQSSINRFLLGSGFILNPLVIISGNTLMETSMGLCLGLLTLRSFLDFYFEKKTFWKVVFYGVFATATRPDYVILVFALFLTKIWKDRKLKFSTLFMGLIFIVLTISPFLIVYFNPAPPINIINAMNLLIKFLRSIMVIMGLWGLPLWIFFVLMFLKKYSILKNLFSKYKFHPLFVGVVILFLFFGIRLFFLPDELEYILILYPISLLLVGYLMRNPKQLIWIAVLAIIPNIAQIYFLEREEFGNLKLSVGFSPGAIYQDRMFRLQNEFEQNELQIILKKISKKMGFERYHFGASTEKGLVFCAKQDLRMYEKGREDPLYEKNFKHQKVIALELPRHSGWKQFTKFECFSKEEIIKTAVEVISINPIKTKPFKWSK